MQIGHGFGLGHTDEVFDNADTGNCLDYSHNPGANLHPGQENFERLQQLYSTNNAAAIATRGRHLRRRKLAVNDEKSEDQNRPHHWNNRLFQLEYDKAMTELHRYLLHIDGEDEGSLHDAANADDYDDEEHDGERWTILEYHDRGSTYQKSFKTLKKDVVGDGDDYNRYTLRVKLLHT